MATISESLTVAIEHHKHGRLAAAEQIYRTILAVDPNQFHALHYLGVIAHQVGQNEAAVDLISRAVQINADAPEPHGNLGNALKDLGRHSEAAACYLRVIELKPNVAEAHANLGLVRHIQGRLVESIACYRQAIELSPDYFEARLNFGNALKDHGNRNEAIDCYRWVVERHPNFAEAHCNLGIALKEQGDFDQAIRCYRHALQLKPNYADAYNNLGICFTNRGEPNEAIACFRQAVRLKPDYIAANSNLLMTLQYQESVSLKSLADAHAEFDRLHAEPIFQATRPQQTLPEQAHVARNHERLRVGFVSSDLGRHPVGYFLNGLLKNIDQSNFETICYSNRIGKDDFTLRLQSAATHWRDVFGMSDDRLAAQIQSDKIDILIDLAGHTANNRLMVFARKPAPMQVTWAGYVGTTGLKSMDFILADQYEIPPSAELYYQERVLRMPDGYICYEPPDDAPPIAPLPALEQNHVTFGCFNNPSKLSSKTAEVWSRILNRIPGSRLLLKYTGCDDSGFIQRTTQKFAVQGIDPTRLEFRGTSPHAQLMAEYNRVDLALDPFPYSGGLTTCEALWMGVPVITCPGETFASRHSLSHLSNIGSTETIATNLDEYVELAVTLACDIPKLASLRAGLRTQMAASPLCDGKRFATNFEKLLRNTFENERRLNSNSLD